MSKKFILFTFFIAIFLLSCRTLQEGVVVAVITHNLHGTLNPSPYRGDFEDYPEPPKKEIKKKEPKTIKEEKPVQTPYVPRYRIELTDAGYVVVLSKPIIFASSEMTMNRKYEDSIDMVLEFLDDYTNAKLIVEGHPDKLSDASYGYMLSRVRASSVCDELIDSEIDGNRLLFYQNNTRIDNASVSMDNESIKFVVINDKNAYAHYLSYLRNYASKYPESLLVKEALPTDLKKPLSDTPSLVLKSGDGSVISKTPSKKSKEETTTKKVVAKEEPATKKVVAKEEPATKKVIAKEEPATKKVVSKEEPATKKVVAKKEAKPKKVIAKKDTMQEPVKEEVVVKEQLPQHIVEKVGTLNLLQPTNPIIFTESSSGIPLKYTNSINDIIRFMNANTNARLVIEGYGDKTTNSNDNIKLSENRGGSVYKALLRSGIDNNRLLLHGSSADINNVAVLADNNSMRFIVIKNSYDYYDYVKYLREYKMKLPATNTNDISDKIDKVYKPDNTEKTITKAKMINPNNNTDIFEFSKDIPIKEGSTKKVVGKKEHATKQAKVVKEPTTKKEPAAKKAQPTKQAKAKKEPAPKQAKANKKTAAKNDIQEVVKVKAETNLKMEYRVLQSGSLYILLEQKPIMFNKGVATVNENRHKESIDYIISFLNASSNSKLVIEGYSDKTGTSNDYVAISKARGYSVYKKLTDSGIAENRLLLYGSNNDINNAHVLLDNNGMRFIIIKDSYAYYNYVNYLRKYIPEAKPIAAPPTIDIKKPTTTAINNKNVIPLNDTNASIVIITEDEYKKEIALANAEKESKEKPAVDEVNEKATKSKKAPPTKQAKVVKEPTAKKAPPAKQAKVVKEPTAKKAPPTKQAKVVKEPTAKKAPPTKQAKVVKEPTTKKAPPNKNAKNTRETSPSINESPKVAIENKGYKIELSNGLQVLLPPDSIAFDYQSAIVDARYKSSIKHIADFLKENPEAKMVIEGNAYESGTDSYNTILSRARANAVYNELLKGGIDRNRLLLHSVGNKTRSVNGNSPKENRIIRFVIIKNQSDYSRYLDFLKRAGV